MSEFLSKLDTVLDNESDRFTRYYGYAFQVIAMEVIGSKRDEADIPRFMYEQLKSSNFDSLYMKICVTADGVEAK